MFRVLIVLVWTGSALLGAKEAPAQEFPNKTMRIVTGNAGGGNDATSRMIAQALSASVGQAVVVENRGGTGIIPAQTVAQAQPDGYSLLLYGGAIWLLPYLQDNVPYDPLKDFAPVTLAAISPNVLLVPPGLPVNSVKDLIDLARAKPGTLNFATSGVGSANHLATELLKSMAGINMVHVPYKGTAPGLADLMGNRVQLSLPSAASATPFITSGKLKALAVTSAKPSALLPGLPTVAASGVPGYEAVSYFAIFAPAKTPKNIVGLLNRKIVEVSNSDEMKKRFFNGGTEVIGSTPEQLTATIVADMRRMGKVIKDAGIKGR